jgi:hypothetical protein
MYSVRKAPSEPSLDHGPDVPAAAMPAGPAHLTAEQVARRLGGEIIATYVSAIPARPVAYGPRDAITVLMAHGHRVALRDGAFFVDGEHVAAGDLDRLAAELEPDAGRPARVADVPETGS